jgi:hypothetical protein
VAIQHRTVAVGDLSRVVQHDDLGREVSSSLGWIDLGVSSDVPSSQFLDGDVLNVETNVVSGNGLKESFVMHLHRLNFSGQVDRGECDHHTWLNNTSFNSAHGDCSDTSDLVHVLERKTESLVGWPKIKAMKRIREKQVASQYGIG